MFIIYKVALVHYPHAVTASGLQTLLRVLLIPMLTLLRTAVGLIEIQVRKELLHTCINIVMRGRKWHKMCNPVKT